MKISGYTTTKNVVQQNYPIEASIRSLYTICDEIVVCDTSDLEDGTNGLLNNLKTEFEGLRPTNYFKVVRNPECDWSKPNFGIYDGLNKAFAKSHCTGDYCIQIDIDEVFQGTRNQIENIIDKSGIDDSVPIISLPVIEPWGSDGKNRIDVNIWKWRIYKNVDWLTHGIPVEHRVYNNGLLYSRPGDDGCTPIDSRTGMRINNINFITDKTEMVRNKAIKNIDLVHSYELYVNKLTDKLPYVHHFSWWSVYQKMLKYKNFWSDSWNSLYDAKKPKGDNPFFNRPLDQVSEKEMLELSLRLENDCGGFIFHSPIPQTIPKTNHFTFNKPIPDLVKDWCNKNKTPKNHT